MSGCHMVILVIDFFILKSDISLTSGFLLRLKTSYRVNFRSVLEILIEVSRQTTILYDLQTV